MGVASLATSIFSNAVAIILVSFYYFLLLIQWGFQNYPTVTRLLVILVVGYLTFKFFIRTAKTMVRFWYNLFMIWLKLSLISIIGIVALATYYRGTRFLTQDLPYITHWLVRDKTVFVKEALENFRSDPSDVFDSFIRWGIKLFASADEANFSFDFNGDTIEITKEGFECLQKKLDSQQMYDAAGQGASYLHDFLEDQGIQVDNLFRQP